MYYRFCCMSCNLVLNIIFSISAINIHIYNIILPILCWKFTSFYPLWVACLWHQLNILKTFRSFPFKTNSLRMYYIPRACRKQFIDKYILALDLISFNTVLNEIPITIFNLHWQRNTFIFQSHTGGLLHLACHSINVPTIKFLLCFFFSFSLSVIILTFDWNLSRVEVGIRHFYKDCLGITRILYSTV